MMADNEEKNMRFRKLSLVVIPLIAMVNAGIFCSLGYLIIILLDIPGRLGIPAVIRGMGIFLIALGFFFLGWMFRYRRISDYFYSTYLSILKRFTRIPLDDSSARVEPLILQGPQKHVRHPTYFSVVVMILGLWMVLDYTFLLCTAFLIFFWFYFVIIYYEEKELKALFKEEYEAYTGCVPKIIPSLKSRWH